MTATFGNVYRNRVRQDSESSAAFRPGHFQDTNWVPRQDSIQAAWQQPRTARHAVMGSFGAPEDQGPFDRSGSFSADPQFESTGVDSPGSFSSIANNQPSLGGWGHLPSFSSRQAHITPQLYRTYSNSAHSGLTPNLNGGVVGGNHTKFTPGACWSVNGPMEHAARMVPLPITWLPTVGVEELRAAMPMRYED